MKSYLRRCRRLLGLGFAWVGVRLMVRYVFVPSLVPGWDQIGIDGRVLAVTAAATVLSALIFGMLPALRTSAIDLRARLAEGGRDGGGRQRGRLAAGLVVIEVAASMALLVACGLLIRGGAALESRDMGLRARDALVLRISLPSLSHPGGGDIATFLDEFSARLSAVPGVTGVALTSGPPIASWSTNLYSIPTLEGTGDVECTSTEIRRVSPAYLDVMEMEIVVGRWFDATDVSGAPRAAVVSSVLADLWWSSPEQALGAEIDTGIRRRIVGVVDAGRLRGAHRDPPPVMFEAIAQRATRSPFFVVGYSAGTPNVLALARDALFAVDSSLALIDPRGMDDLMDDALVPQRIGLQMLAALGGLALVLTLVGVYGVMAHAMNQRTREVLGLRMALGASGAQVTRLVMRRNVVVALTGIALGAALGAAIGRGLSFLLAGVDPTDPLALASVGAMLFAAVLVASYFPARRAARFDPAGVLKED